MGEIVVTYYECDRCKCRMDKKPPVYRDGIMVGLGAVHCYDVAQGDSFNWQLLCDECHGYVARLITGVLKEALGARKK